jgi:hypothetical protein
MHAALLCRDSGGDVDAWRDPKVVGAIVREFARRVVRALTCSLTENATTCVRSRFIYRVYRSARPHASGYVQQQQHNALSEASRRRLAGVRLRATQADVLTAACDLRSVFCGDRDLPRCLEAHFH